MRIIKDVLKASLGWAGYEIRSTKRPGISLFSDMQRFLHSTEPIIFDVGANCGQSIKRFRAKYPSSFIYAFEPVADTFKKLEDETRNLKNIELWQLALGEESGIAEIKANSSSDMSSFLPLGPAGWGAESIQKVNVCSLDEFAAMHTVEHIDLLKSDTQGFEFSVIKGASSYLEKGKIRAIIFEVNFIPMYIGQVRFSNIHEYLTQKGYQLVAFHDFNYSNGFLGWADVLYARND